MSVLGNLEPKNVFRFFEEICAIPHGSGNTRGLTAYLMNFAKERGIEARSDELGNVVMRKPATPGYEDVPGVILQGHMDMVAVKTPDSLKDMAREGLDLAVDGDYVYAVNTSLGGDDGIAVAYALAVMDAADLEHPEVEAIITVDEETGLFGAKGIDIRDIKGRRFINIDSEEEGIFLTSCAGGARVKSTLPMDMASVEGMKLSVAVKGLQGGHSGADIHRERGNALYLLARILYHASREVTFYIADFHGGTVENAIPREAYAEVVLATACQACSTEEDVKKSAAKFEALISQAEQELKEEYATRDSGIYVEVTEEMKDAYAVYSRECSMRLLKLLAAAPVGVQAMSQDMPGLVETSLNLGVVESFNTDVKIQYSVRSSVESAKAALMEKLEIMFDLCGADMEVSGEYPGWAYKVDSPLRDKMVRVYEEVFGVTPEIQAIHAGLECGLFLGKQPDLDCISFGPNMYSIHTTEEKLSISSTKRMWEFLTAVLRDKA